MERNGKPCLVLKCNMMFSLLAEVSHDEARRVPRRERPLLAGNMMLHFFKKKTRTLFKKAVFALACLEVR